MWYVIERMSSINKFKGIVIEFLFKIQNNDKNSNKFWWKEELGNLI